MILSDGNVLTYFVFTAKYIDVEPVWITMNSTHVFAASKENFFVWHFRTPKSRSTLEMAGIKIIIINNNNNKKMGYLTNIIQLSGSRRERKEKVYHVDDTPSGAADIIKERDKTLREVGKLLTVGKAVLHWPRSPVCKHHRPNLLRGCIREGVADWTRVWSASTLFFAPCSIDKPYISHVSPPQDGSQL